MDSTGSSGIIYRSIRSLKAGKEFKKAELVIKNNEGYDDAEKFIIAFSVFRQVDEQLQPPSLQETRLSSTSTLKAESLTADGTQI
jgi:hypothetical protein